ncbi:MAG: PKD domain-containing protein [Bacteroidetes bacterium]|nr:PKD domain-containing protein [Bacteroidota bacterium]
MDFNSGTATYLGGSINTEEGVSTWCDDNGQVLIYTDGSYVYDKNHTAMPNGTGLMGGPSSTQSALIIPAPGNPNLFFVFTTMSIGSYSTVDLTLNGGNGDVVVKNSFLLNNVTEKLCGCRHANGVDYWVLYHGLGNNTTYAYLLTAAGVSGAPVVSNTGLLHNDAIGQMKFNRQATKLATAMLFMNQYELLDFDNSTGVVSNPIPFPATYPYPYGIEFSLDGKYMYTAHGLGTGEIHQFDISSGNAAAIFASDYLVGTVPAAELASLQMGPDKKIYSVGWYNFFISCINNPENGGAACNFVQQQIITPTGVNGGLPNIVYSLLSAATIKNFCFNDTTQFLISDSNSYAGVSWNFDDPSSGLLNSSYSFNTGHVFTAPGNYNVQVVTVSLSAAVDTQYYQVVINAPPAPNLGADSTLCIGQSYTLNPGTFSSYVWSNGSTASTLAATTNGTFAVMVENTEGCKASDSVNLNFIPCASVVINISANDSVFCDKNCINFTDLTQNNPYSWMWYFTGASPATSTDQNPVNICYNTYGVFNVTLVACNLIGCDSVVFPAFITEFQLPQAPVATLSGNTLSSTTAFSYQWFIVGDTTVYSNAQSFTPTVNGSYYVLISDSNGLSGTKQCCWILLVSSGVGERNFCSCTQSCKRYVYSYILRIYSRCKNFHYRYCRKVGL